MMHTHRLKQIMGFALGAAMLGVSVMPAADAQAAAKTSATNAYVTGVALTANGLTFMAKATSKPAGLHLDYQFREERHGRWFIAQKFNASRTFVLPYHSAVAAVEAYALTKNQVIHKQWSKAVPSAPVRVPKVGQAGLAVTISAVLGNTGSDSAAIVNDVVYSAVTGGTGDNGDTVTIAQGSGVNTPSTAAFSGGALDITIGTDGTGQSLATSNTALVSQIQEALSAGSISTITVSLESGALGSATPAVSGAGTFAGGSNGLDGVDTLTVGSGVAYDGTLAVAVTSGSNTVGSTVVPLTAGETAAAVATAIDTALNRAPFTAEFSVANPSSGVVTLTQLTPLPDAIGVTVTG